jgi:hypothetical protein
MIDR